MLEFTDINDEVINQNQQLLQKLNNEYHKPIETNQIISEITGKKIDQTTEVRLPFFTDYGRNISMGQNVFINSNVTMVDLGGIRLEDNVLIGPGSTLISVNHVEDPKHRRDLELSPVLIKKGAWIGANVTILPGITIGENAIVGAGSIVTKDVDDATIVIGNPAKKIRKIKEN